MKTRKRNQRGFGLIETVMAASLLGVGMLATVQMLNVSGDAALVHEVRTRAVGEGQGLLDVLGGELMQSAGEAGSGGTSRITVSNEGKTIQFQRITGTTVGTLDNVSPTWSPSVTVSWDDKTFEVSRLEAGVARVLAENITQFEARQLPDGLIVVEVTGKRKSPKGQDLEHHGKIRILPRNTPG